MADRVLEIARFLNGSEWATVPQTALAGDASGRRYFRLIAPNGKSAVLMDAPPALCGSQASFVRIAAHLQSIGLSAPYIYQADLETGLLLIQDFGDRVFTSEAERSVEVEKTLYSTACDVLIQLNQPALDGLPEASPAHLADQVMLAFSHYGPGGSNLAERQMFKETFQDFLEQAIRGEKVMVLRDYFAGNLVWRPDQVGLARAGILDFQDALAGHPAYDLVSLLQDARRDLQPGLETAMIKRYISATEVEPVGFQLAYHAIAVQRHLRILGVFARLSLEMGKPRYLAFIPRTWAHLQSALAHPGLAPVAEQLQPLLPSPSPEHLAALRGA